ncbi:MAG: nicotinate-nucleotide adenylyltransferase [Sterolibacteriaceae bacterium MAG5]|nr:nicotinate-nucleotide adenylyltransferase [Candidatus Nitricoxidireducens bremensis]
MSSPGPLGILGGTFDPVHRAHLHLARAALGQLRLAAVTWVPAGQPSHRHPPHAAAEHRLAMVQLAVADEPRFTVDTGDVDSGAPSYTVPTLERLRRQFGADRPLVLLVGADAFLGLPSWYRWQEIFRLAHVAVAARPGAEIAAAALAPPLADIYRARSSGRVSVLTTAPAGSIVGFEIEPVEPPDLSATMVREHLRSGSKAGLADLLPPGVLDYILRNHLYSA